MSSCNILKVSEKNCYSHKHESNYGDCQHVCVVFENNTPVSKILNSKYIYEKLGSDAPMHIRKLYE